ncbi:hypothetical protein [Marinomonas posidonica]|uniref:SnoaL-like domain-containing protein n=1 Tax=Marinomonas posidonica (strain CECT 7376 / NCIMB 14433 / IVIA-Po-181) TaxID=491952 RepID=F6CVG1_MARPP|nr:hypothetical protein [Marinomonas posidonica]AEF55338.1 hypothetical protein Mar181_2302 [Marinomonas posidonica IVIA-Po-181]
MTEVIAKFFDAWQVTDAEARLVQVESAVTNEVEYLDPRTPEAVIGPIELNHYIGMFSANAPGWSANLVSSDITGNMTRAVVAFSGVGPDGNQQVQYGQYFVEYEGELISRMVGFVGIGRVD